MKKKNGFTLIELLAVIVVLAIIALIAVPIVLNLIERSRKGAAIDSAYGYKEAINDHYLSELIDNPNYILNGKYKVGSNGILINTQNEEESYNIEVSGSKPSNGEVTFVNNVMTEACLIISGYKVTLEDGKFTSSGKGECDSVQEEQQVEESSKDWFTYDEETGTITGFSDTWNNLEDENKYDIVIPSKTPEGNDIVAIRDGAFSSKSLTSVIIPDSVITIGNGAFNQNNITSLDLGESVETIGVSSFYGNKLESVIIPDSVIKIDSAAFYQNNLTTLDLGEGVQTIGQSVFFGNKLEHVVIPDSVIKIDSSAFNSNNITSLDLGEGVQIIGQAAFNTNKLEYLKIPSSVTQILAGAFAINNLNTVELESNVQTIENGAFGKGNESNPNLAQIINKTGKSFDWDSIINNSSYGRYTFATGTVENNYGDVDVILNDQTEDIKEPSDTTPSPLNWFTFDEETGTITGFSDTWNNLEDANKYDIVIPSKTPNGNAVTTIGMNAFLQKKLTSVVIPEGIITIESGSFDFNELESVIIPNSVQMIGEAAFAANKLKSLKILDSALTIGNSSFYNNPLVNVDLGKGVHTIERAAFMNDNIKSLIIPDSVTSIGDNAFHGNKLIMVDIGKGIETIDQCVFNKATATNPNLRKIINRSGKVFDWNRIINCLQSDQYTFATGTVDHDLGDVVITNK